MQKWQMIHPVEENDYSFFEQNIETNNNIFIHITRKVHLNSIIKDGFKTAQQLGTGDLESVSFGNNSAACLPHFNNYFPEEMIAFAVLFNDEQLKHITVNPSDIHVYKNEIRPAILGYCDIPAGYRVT